MELKNPWFGYLDRGYTNIKNSILNRVSNLLPELTDLGENNILVIMASSFAGLGEQLNYYIDNLARELYNYGGISVKLTRLINYRIKTSIAAYVDLNFAVDGSGNPFQ